MIKIAEKTVKLQNESIDYTKPLSMMISVKKIARKLLKDYEDLEDFE